jgi:hypothetical protein
MCAFWLPMYRVTVGTCDRLKLHAKSHKPSVPALPCRATACVVLRTAVIEESSRETRRNAAHR